MMTTSASDHPHLRIPAKQWRAVLNELATRGCGRRESGAFLLGRRRGRRPKVTHVAYFDDLEPEPGWLSLRLESWAMAAGTGRSIALHSQPDSFDIVVGLPILAAWFVDTTKQSGPRRAVRVTVRQ